MHLGAPFRPLRPPRRPRPPPRPFAPRAGGLKLPPAALVYLFPELFTGDIDPKGFKSPCSTVKVKHEGLFLSMLTSTFIFLGHSGIISLKPDKTGLIFKTDIVSITKLASYRPRKFGYMARKIDNLSIGEKIRLYDAVVENIKTENPALYFIMQVFNNDLSRTELFHMGNPHQPLCVRILDFKDEAHRLSVIVRRFRAKRPKLYEIMLEEGKRILDNMKK